MTREQFNLEWNGKKNDDGSVPGQCVNVIHSYFKEVLGLPVFHGNAIDYWKDIPGFQRISKTWYNMPQPGDIMVFNIGPNGHIAVCNWSRLMDFGGFEQNFPVGSPCHYQDHPNYKNVLGWLRPLPQPHTFTMRYTVYNGDQATMEAARQLLLQYTNNRIDANFEYQTLPTESGIFTTDKQVLFTQTHRITNSFVMYFYDAGIPNYAQMATAEVPKTLIILTAATPQAQTALNVCYEFCNALCDYFYQPLDDIYTPTEEFLKQRFAKLLPNIKEVSL